MRTEVWEALARCRVFELHLIQKYLSDVMESELDILVEKGLLQREVAKKHLKIYQYYSLTDEGEAFVRTECPHIREFYRGFVLEHDLELMEFYLKRHRDEQQTWKTRNDLNKEFKLPGAVDGAFLNASGEWEGVEVLNRTTNISAIERIERFLKQTNIPQITYVMC